MPELVISEANKGVVAECALDRYFPDVNLIGAESPTYVNIRKINETGSASKYQLTNAASSAPQGPLQTLVDQAILGWLTVAAFRGIKIDQASLISNVGFDLTGRLWSQTEAQVQRIQGLKEYLDLCVGSSAISGAVSRAAWWMWLKMNFGQSGKLEVPDACPGANGDILLTWDRAQYHFELEIGNNLTATFFYVDSNLGQAWELTAKPNESIHKSVSEVLRRFTIQDSTARTQPSQTST